MYAYTAETGHLMNFSSLVGQYSPEDVAREMARRSFGRPSNGLTAPEVRASYTAHDHGTVRSGAQRFTVIEPGNTDALTVFIGTREQVDALVW